MSEVVNVKIGLEVHCQLTNLQTKLFCSSPADYRQKPPNTNICPVCIGTPGSLPVLNRKAIYHATMVALALNFKLPDRMLFFRKNYFYPDMSKNFQITQYDRAGGVPFATNGYILLDNGNRIRLERMQLEEDPAKLSYDGTIESSPRTYVDYNRAGVALIELVTKPDIRSPREAREFLNKLSSILEHLCVSDLALEGSLRCDANISLAGGRRVEVKNISSFKEVERALNFEISRQKSLTSKGISISQETRHWDEVRRITISLRLKEEEHDYRYFPEADLVPVVLSKKLVDIVRNRMPELPEERERRFRRNYNLSSETAQILVREKSIADFFEESLNFCRAPRELGSWLAVDLQAYLNETGKDLRDLKITPKHLAELVDMIGNAEISRVAAKTIFLKNLQTGQAPHKIAEENRLKVIGDLEYVKDIIEKVFKENPQAVQDALKDEKAINFLLGRIMQMTRGRVDPALANRIVRKLLSTANHSE